MEEKTNACAVRLTFAIASIRRVGKGRLRENWIRIWRCPVGRRAIADRSVIHGGDDADGSCWSGLNRAKLRGRSRARRGEKTLRGVAAMERVVKTPMKLKEGRVSSACAMKIDAISGAERMCCDGLELS